MAMKKKSKNNNNRSLPSGFFSFYSHCSFVSSFVRHDDSGARIDFIIACRLLCFLSSSSWTNMRKKIIAIHIHIQNNEKLNATNLVTEIDYLSLSLFEFYFCLLVFLCLCLCFSIIQQHDWIQIWMKKKH